MLEDQVRSDGNGKRMEIITCTIYVYAVIGVGIHKIFVF